MCVGAAPEAQLQAALVSGSVEAAYAFCSMCSADVIVVYISRIAAGIVTSEV